MKAYLIALSVVLMCGSMLTAQPAPKAMPGKSAQRPPARVMTPAARSNFLARTGGMIQSKTDGPSLLFLNTQTRVNADALNAVTVQIEKFLRLPFVLKTNPSLEPVADALKSLSDTNIAAVVVIADVKGYPALLIAPENRWALVNVAALDGANISSATLTDRTQKEVWRAFGYLMGAANSTLEHCLLKSVLQPADLDAFITKTLSPEPFEKILSTAQRLGMTPWRMTTYRKAVEEGWAPAPTNDIQRAIWNSKNAEK